MRFRATCYRNVMGAILISIVLVMHIKNKGLRECIEQKKCSKQVCGNFSDIAEKYIYFENATHSETLNATELRHWLQRQNALEEILNLEFYGPLTNDTLIFVVQVHQYSCNLNYLLASLSDLKGIQDTLIIFSHSYVDNNINHLIQSIDFCRTLQLFYPYSIQSYPNDFPGYHKDDCPPNLNKKEAEELNCTGAINPDMYGRYRNPIYAQMKHHWWWTSNKVFEDLSCTRGHKGIVVFLEHNYFLLKDFIYLAHRMKNIADSLPQCEFLSLGTTVGMANANDDSLYRVEFTTWDPKYHSNVLAMDVSTWNIIESHYDLFCLIDDYSWSRSLLHVSLNRRNGNRFKVLSSVVPRALQTTPCPPMGEGVNRGVLASISKTLHLRKSIVQSWFPPYLELYSNIELEDDEFVIFDYMDNNGGWNDPRDKELCSDITLNKAKRYFLNMNRAFLDYRDL